MILLLSVVCSYVAEVIHPVYAQSRRERNPPKAGCKYYSSSENGSVLVVLFFFFLVILLLILVVLIITLNHPHPPILPPAPPNKPKRIIDQWKIALTGLLVLREDHKVLLPDPAQTIGRVVLILRKPQFALLRDDIEDLALYVGEVRVATFLAGFVDVELE